MSWCAKCGGLLIRQRGVWWHKVDELNEEHAPVMSKRKGKGGKGKKGC